MPEVSFISLLNENDLIFARMVIFQLQLLQERKKDHLVFNGQKFSQQEVRNALIGWAKASFPDNFKPEQPENKRLDPNDKNFLHNLFNLISEKIKQTVKGQNLPSLKELEYWQQELKDNPEWSETISQISEAHLIERLKELDLTAQIRTIKQYQLSIKQKLASRLPDYLTDREKEEVLSKVAESLTRDLASLSPEDLNEDSIWYSIESLCGRDAQVGAALSKKNRDELSRDISKDFSSGKNEKLAKAQEKINQAVL